ncbi:hypothetical protein [Vulcanisaeta distributa]|uniref:hypothetical protein n=1 Tax=Vulcanisaeta distributa TaxID=164451 RepID=UPI0006D2B365|nr:hypothetical protein [Vulcanisaeta distributa]
MNSLGRLLRTLARYVEEGDKLLKEYVNRLVQEIPESTIVLFGSRARGDYLPIVTMILRLYLGMLMTYIVSY